MCRLKPNQWRVIKGEYREIDPPEPVFFYI